MRAAPFLIVALGGAAGAAARLGVTETLGGGPGSFDWSLLAMNTAGSFLLGLVLFAASDSRHEFLRLGLGVGFCGSFTTFSAFAVIAAELGRDGEAALALAFIVLSIASAVAALVAGGATARRMTRSRTP